MRDVLEALEVRLTTVNITALRDGIFFADLIFSNGREVSARPSDSIGGRRVQVAGCGHYAGLPC